MTEGTSVFTTLEPLRPHLRWLPLRTRTSCPCPRGFGSWAWACSTHDVRWDEVSDTPVATPSFSPRSRAFARARFFDSTYGPLCVRGARVGRKSEEAAETTVTNGSWNPPAGDDPRCLPSSGSLRRIRWPLQPRSRDHRTAFGDVATAGWRSHVTLGLNPSSCRCGPARSEMRIVFSNRRACRRVTADTRPDLGPRSLDPDRSFWSAFAELIWSQTPPADFCNCYDERALSTSSYDPRRDDHRDGLPFLNAPRPLPCGSGETQRAAHRPPDPTPVPVPPGCPGLPDRDTEPCAPPSRVAPTKLQWR